MKKLFGVAIIAGMLMACDNEPVFHGLTQQEKESYAQSIKGEYPGRYTIVYTDRQTTGSDTKLLRETVDDVTFSVSDLTAHTIIFNNFPLSLLARVVDDPELGQALSTLPNMGLTGNYEFTRAVENGMVGWSFDINPVALSLTYGGQQHNIVLHFGAPSGFLTLAKGQIDGGTAFEQGRQLTLELNAIYEGDQLIQQF
ncbi:MAG: DUF4840 domain-containing protein, partial [Prevotella sp.]|nr:DUF4840 domain-containing protein [Prevotella sp.]